MNETQFQMIWEKRLFPSDHLTTTCGKSVIVLDPGVLNKHQGPDFNFARLLIEDQVWVGSIELHMKTSDWYLHRHQYDLNYKTVILHVVWENDLSEFSQSPVLELNPFIRESILTKELSNHTSNNSIRCSTFPASFISQEIYDWIKKLGLSRLDRKSDQIIELLELYRGDWDAVTWLLMAKGFGHNVNTDAFFALAKSVPFFLIRLYKYDLESLEALLFGQSGMLQHYWHDSYPTQLASKYDIIKRKYGLKQINHPLMFLRMRPSNFPTIRISQLASLYYHQQHVFRSIIDGHDISAIKDMLGVSGSTYWETHIAFDKYTEKHSRLIGDTMVNTLIINVILPILLAYAKAKGNTGYRSRALDWFHQLKSESNSILDQFKKAGFSMKNACESQSLLELHKEYCSQGLCQSCLHGKAVFNPN